MAQTYKFGNGTWATKKGSTLAYNDENNNYKPLPFTTTRNSIATRVNKQGLIEVVGNNVPRIDYTDSADGVLLLEPQRTNLVTTSETLSNYWNLQEATLIVDNQAVNPTGSLYANKLNTSNAAAFRGLVKSESTAYDGKTLNVSVFAKKITSDYIFFYNIGSTSGVNGIWFNISNGTLGNIGGAWSNSKIENYGNGWYRCSTTITFGTGTNYLYLLNSDGNGNTTSTIGSQTYLWGSQVEEGTYPTSYIPTSGSSVTRQADTANGSGNSEVFNDSEGVLFADIAALSDDLTFRLISLSDGTTSNRLSLGYRSTSNAIYCEIRNANATQAFLITTINDIKTKSKVSVKYKENDFAMWVNGFEVSTDTSGITPINLSKINFDSGQQSGGYFYGNTKEIGYYDTALTDEELEYLTSYRSLNELVTELNLNTL